LRVPSVFLVANLIPSSKETIDVYSYRVTWASLTRSSGLCKLFLVLNI
jgi:hypothetical protein